MRNPPPIRNEETPTTDTLLARWWVSGRSWGYLFRRRQELGVARYGVPLQPFNGRDAILDASEEFQDATVYAEQCIREGRLPIFAGAVVQILCLFALRVLWHYASGGTRHRIVGLDRTDATEELFRYRKRLLEPEPTEQVLEDAPTMVLNVAVPKVVDWDDVTAREAEEDNALEVEPEPEPEPRLQGFWSKNGPIYNGQQSWQWVGPGDNRGASVSKLMNSLWEDRLRSENASLS